MTQIKPITLEHFKDAVGDRYELLKNGFITQNLAAIREVDISLLGEMLNTDPIILREMRILMLREGEVAPVVNLTKRTFRKGDLVFLAPNSIVQYENIQSNSKGIGISASDEILAIALGNNVPKAFDGHVRDFVINLSEDEQAYFDQLHLLLYSHAREENGVQQVTLHLLSALLWYVNALWSRHDDIEAKEQSREQRLFTEFIQLVNTHVREHQSVEFFASKLCLSPRYVSSLVKQMSGHTAKKWIDDVLITNIKVELKHTDKPINVISDEFGFPNTSFFCKYFKRLTGTTPNLFRNHS